jgi:putative CocE/NonD family hydrolase
MTIEIEQNIMVPMRDGVRLAVDVYKPAREGRWPVLLTRLPYNKDLRFPVPGLEQRRVFLELDMDVERVVEAGYVIVAQDTRGRFASEGDFAAFQHEDTDGADTIAWAASQPWSDGNVGMYGVSYQALTQWQAAGERPEALRAIAPAQAPRGTLYPYQGGAFHLHVAFEWTVTQGVTGDVARQVQLGQATQAELDEIVQAEQKLATLYPRLPLTNQPLIEGRAPYYFDWLAHPTFDAYWQALIPDHFYERITVPALIVAGWYDFFQRDDLTHYRSIRQQAGSDLARQHSRLVIGPWGHGSFLWGLPERQYEEQGAAIKMLTDLQLRWFDHWLKGIENGVEREKPVKIFVMGINQWREEEAWPLPDTHYRPYYLHSGGHANTLNGDGLLSLEQAGDEPEDVYRYDPHHPVPTMGGALMMEEVGPRDQRQIEAREDVLCYTTPLLEQPVEVTGPVELVLYVSSSAPDTDFTGKLVDVHPDGRAENLLDGILRARYRESLSASVLMEPGQVYELHIELGATSNVFQAGHRIRLEVSSSNFPRFDRNTNTGGIIANEGEQDLVEATNRIHHNAAHPSHLILPIIER